MENNPLAGCILPRRFIVEERHTADLPKRPGVRHLKVTPTMRNLLRSGKANRIAGRDDIGGFQTGKSASTPLFGSEAMPY